MLDRVVFTATLYYVVRNISLYVAERVTCTVGLFLFGSLE